ncbi:MAG: LamG-like jellyroll fold domain-containing protein [Akkermansiaceae bacterium]
MTPREIEFLLQRLVDGKLDEEACEELISLIKEDEAVLEKYCQYAELDSGLSYLSSGMTPADVPGKEAENISALVRKRQTRLTWRVTILTSAAAVAMLIFALSAILLKPPPPSPATFLEGPGTALTITHPEESGTLSSSALEIGSVVNLTSGTLELNLESGVRSLIEAPALFHLSDKNRLTLDHGIVWSEVPKGAEGFQVVTPTLEVTDLGTEFAVISFPGESEEVHVFKGSVEIANGSNDKRTLSGNEAIRFLPDQGYAEIPASPDNFLTKLPKPEGHFHWSFDENDAGSQAVAGSMPDQRNVISRCSTREGNEPFASFSVVDGRFGNALSSFGRNGMVQTDWPGIPEGSDFTVSYWIKMTPGQHSPYSLVSWGSQSPQTPQLFSSEIRKTKGGSVTAVTLGSNEFIGTSPIDDGEWHHIVICSKEQLGKAPLLECYIDGEHEALAPGTQISHLTAPDGSLTDKESPTLTLLDHPSVQAKTGEKINLSLIRENGTTSVYLNGKNIGVSNSSPPPFEAITHLMVGANLDGAGALEGFFHGAIDHLKLSTFTGSLASRELLGDNHADIRVVAEFDFEDSTTPKGFQEIGSPRYEDGKLILGGKDALVMTPSPLTATDNFIIEISCTMTGYPTNPSRFSFPVSNGDGFNRGWGILYHHTWGGILMGHGPVGSATTDENKIPIEIDELHIFSRAIRPREIKNLATYNQTNRITNKQP